MSRGSNVKACSGLALPPKTDRQAAQQMSRVSASSTVASTTVSLLRIVGRSSFAFSGSGFFMGRSFRFGGWGESHHRTGQGRPASVLPATAQALAHRAQGVPPQLLAAQGRRGGGETFSGVGAGGVCHASSLDFFCPAGVLNLVQKP